MKERKSERVKERKSERVKERKSERVNHFWFHMIRQRDVKNIFILSFNCFTLLVF